VTDGLRVQVAADDSDSDSDSDSDGSDEDANTSMATALAETESWKAFASMPQPEILRRREWVLAVPLFSGLDGPLADAIARAFEPRVMVSHPHRLLAILT
jgi:hypothetical protein